MRRRICVLVVLLSSLGLAGFVSGQEAAQVGPTGSSGARGGGFHLEQNYPNPFNPETKIPFVLDDDLFQGGGPVEVTLRIYNVLQQYVATPTALNNPQGDGTPVQDLEYDAPGRYEAFWNGRDQAGHQVASGVYFVQLVVNGKSQIRKMFVAK